MLEAFLVLNTAAGGWLGYIGLMILGVVSVYFKGRSDGRLVEKVKSEEADEKAKSISKEVDSAVASRDPSTNRKRLSEWGK